MILISQTRRPGSELVPDANTNNTLFSGLKSRYCVCPGYTYTTLYKLSKCVHLFYHSWKSRMTTDSCFYWYCRQFLSRIATKNSAGGSSVPNGRLLFRSICVRRLASSILCTNMKYWDLKFETFSPSKTKVWERGQLSRTLWTLCFLLSSSVGDLQCEIGQSAADSEATGMRIIAVMSEAMVLYWEKKVDCPFCGGLVGGGWKLK